MEHGAIVVGVIMGSVYDPVFLSMLAIAAGLTFLPSPACYIVLGVVAVIAGTLRVSISYANRAALGLPESPISAHIFVGTSLSMLAAFGLVFLIRRLFTGNDNPPHPR